ncbi:hypothetical protein ACP4OV_012355 [Aristida adscensionis]
MEASCRIIFCPAFSPLQVGNYDFHAAPPPQPTTDTTGSTTRSAGGIHPRRTPVSCKLAAASPAAAGGVTRETVRCRPLAEPAAPQR